MGIKDMAFSYLLFSVLHFFCFVLALTTIGLYGTDIHHANQQGKYSDSKWVYGVVVGTISAVTCLVYFIPLVLRLGGIIIAAWDMILFILWIALFGVFGKMYIHEDAEGDGDVQRMKNAVWVDLTSALLWLFATLAAFAHWFKTRDTRSTFTGRAHV
ncbi:hypothetical protein FZEAL_8387 [Fusarium zealandicum]|uniref:MARVEL domain-containing protein n=1 Tax=Fusarium zealandicum TaxID=1053134 RepID=A0A8H4UDX1_9HYPO|nr:hypothetical protein FZEAL_8387 [Fusarium zealandicum]